MCANHAIGVDLGTTRTGAAYVPEDEPEMIPNRGGNVLTPSVVFVPNEDESTVGDDAQGQLVMDPDRAKKEVKRQMGTDDTITLGNLDYTPEEISAMILDKVKSDTEDYLGEPPNEAVITVPAQFSDNQRAATRSAADIAGLDVQRLLPEPSAACIAYGLKEGKLNEDKQELVFVFDLGGGTFDATLADVNYSVNHVHTEKTYGDMQLGGSDWTQRIEEWMLETIEKDTGVDLANEPELEECYQNVLQHAEDAKKKLSSMSSVDISVPMVVPQQTYAFSETLTRDKFEDMTSDLIERTQEPMDELFNDTEYSVEDVDKVLLVGGATRMQQVEAFVEDYFGQEPSREIHPDEAVALGAAVKAELLDRNELPPGEQEEKPSILPGDEEITVTNLVPQSLGVRLADDTIDKLIMKGNELPQLVENEKYTTKTDTQTAAKIEVYEGEGETADETTQIGDAHLSDIPQRSSDQHSISVRFEMGEDGILEVKGEDLISGKTDEVTITSTGRHSDQEISEMHDNLPRQGNPADDD